MKNIIIVLSLICLVSATVFADNSFSTSAAFSFMSNYVWRGEKLSDKGVFQPEITITHKKLSFGVWYNYDFDENRTNETDYLLYYDWETKQFYYEVGYCGYSYPFAADTREFYATITHKSLWSPSVSFYRDDQEGHGNFLNLQVSRSWSMAKNNTLNFSASVGYNIDHAAMGADSNGDTFTGFYNGQLDLSLDIPVNKKVTITPKIGYSFPLSDKADTALSGISYGGDSRVFYGGLTCSVDF